MFLEISIQLPATIPLTNSRTTLKSRPPRNCPTIPHPPATRAATDSLFIMRARKNIRRFEEGIPARWKKELQTDAAFTTVSFGDTRYSRATGADDVAADLPEPLHGAHRYNYKCISGAHRPFYGRTRDFWVPDRDPLAMRKSIRVRRRTLNVGHRDAKNGPDSRARA